MTFSFFLSIYSRCGVPASLAARHTTVCLDIWLNFGCTYPVHITQILTFTISEPSFDLMKLMLEGKIAFYVGLEIKEKSSKTKE